MSIAATTVALVSVSYGAGWRAARRRGDQHVRLCRHVGQKWRLQAWGGGNRRGLGRRGHSRRRCLRRRWRGNHLRRRQWDGRNDLEPSAGQQCSDSVDDVVVRRPREITGKLARQQRAQAPHLRSISLESTQPGNNLHRIIRTGRRVLAPPRSISECPCLLAEPHELAFGKVLGSRWQHRIGDSDERR